MPHTVDGVIYTVPLALVDFLPVIFSFLGCLVLARMVAREQPRAARWAYLAAVLIGLGGLCKSTWKLLVAAAEVDIAWLDGMLFVLMGPGFLLLAWAVLSVRKGRLAMWWPYAVLGALAVIGAVAVQSTAPMLGITALGSMAVSFYAVLMGWSRRDWLVMALFSFSILVALVLVPLGSPSREQTIALQWFEETTNTLGQLAFLLGALRLAAGRLRDRTTGVPIDIDTEAEEQIHG